MIKAGAESAASERVLSSDKPVESANQDRLGYAAFAETIAASIVKRTTSDSIVYAIHGPWGSGKTSAVNMLVEAVSNFEIDKDEKAQFIIVRFNPWWFSDQSDLTKNFFNEIAASLDQGRTKKIAEGLRKVGRQLSGAKDLLGALVSLAPGGGVASPFIKGGFEALNTHLNEDESLEGVRQELIKTLNKQKQRILVVIDDIDRLPADEAKQIFRLVKSVADLPNMAYLLVFDRDIAQKAVGDSGTADGPEWLEKIVQASFDLPPVHPIDIRKMLIEGINEIIGKKDSGNGTQAANIMFACVFPWIATPRDVNRLLNAINVSLPAVINDVNIIEFIAIETLRIFEPRLYRFIRDQKDSLTGVSDSQRRQNDTIGRDLLIHVSESKKGQVKEALQRLFPRLESIWNNLNYGGDFVIKWDQNRRVCVPRHFSSYFSYMVGDDTLKTSEVTSLIASLTERSQFSVQVERLSHQKRRNGTTKAALVLDTIRNESAKIAECDLVDVIATMLDAGLLLYPHHDRGSGFVDFPFTWNFWFSLRPLIEKLDRAKRAILIIDAIDQSESLVALNFVVTALEGETGLHEGFEEKPVEIRTVGEAELKKIQNKLVDRITVMAERGELVRQYELNHLLFRWSEAAGTDAVKLWTTGLLESDESISILAKSLLSPVSTHASRDYISTTSYRVDREVVAKYVDVDILAQRLQALDEKTDGGVEVAKQFMKALED